MRSVILATLLLFIPSAFAACGHCMEQAGYRGNTPGYYFMHLNGYYYPNYQNPRFFQYESCNAYKPYQTCHSAKLCSSCGEHYHRYYDNEGLSKARYYP